MNIKKLIKKKFIIPENDVPPTVLRTRGVRRNKATRDVIVEIVGECGFKYGVEVGCLKAGFSIKLIRSMGDDGKLMLVDPWLAYERHSDSTAQSFYEAAMDNLEKTGCKGNAIINRRSSLDAVKEIKDGSLDFVYIDGCHDFNNAVMDIVSWAPKVKSGGIVSGHDYYHGPDFGVIQAVDAYTRCNHIDEWYITREGVTSFFWIQK